MSCLCNLKMTTVAAHSRAIFFLCILKKIIYVFCNWIIHAFVVWWNLNNIIIYIFFFIQGLVLSIKFSKNSSEFWPNSQISENSPGFLKMCSYQNSLEKILIIFSASCTKIFRIFDIKLALSTNSQKKSSEFEFSDFPETIWNFFWQILV